MLMVLLGTAAVADEYEEAVNLIKKKNYSVAITLLNADRQTGDTAKNLYALGYCYEKQGDKLRAVTYYRMSVRVNVNKGNRISAEAEMSLKRLYALVPHIFPVLSKAWDLETEAYKHKVGTTEREYMLNAARMLYEFALNGETWQAAKMDAQENKPQKPMVSGVGVMPRVANTFPFEKARFVHPTGSSKPLPPRSMRERLAIEKALGYRLKMRPAHAVRTPGGSWAKYFPATVSWSEAKKRCQDMGGYLFVPETPAEFEFAGKLAPKNVTNLWIGAVVSNGSWAFVSGQSIKDLKWNPKAKGKGPCAYMSSGSGEWKACGYPDRVQDTIPGFICEWEK
jgi:hypothetical protein